MEQNRKEEKEEEEELPPRDIPGCPVVRTLLSLLRAQGHLLVTEQIAHELRDQINKYMLLFF